MQMSNGDTVTSFGFYLAQPMLQLTQLAIAVNSEFHGRLFTADEFLGHAGNSPVCGHLDITAVSMQFTAQEREQAGFTGTIGAGHAHFLAGMNLQAGCIEQQARSAAQCDISEL